MTDTVSMTDTVPHYDADLFSDEAILDPYPHYQALRDLGPVVWLTAHDMYAVGRYADVRAALADNNTFVSGHGVGFNGLVNTNGQGTTLMSDGALHTHLRSILARRLNSRSLHPIRDLIDTCARDVVRQAVARGSFDAVADLARPLPVSIVPDLVGWPENGRDDLLDWAAAAFDILGPMNERAQQAAPRLQAMGEFAARTVAARDVLPGSAADHMLGAIDRGELAPEQAIHLVIDYIAPSLDTTISAIGNAIWLLAENPEQWAQLRADPSLVPNAFNEALRLETPVRCFTRVCNADTRIGDDTIAAGSRVMIVFASANRDERFWADADTFDLDRATVTQHVGFGYGVHGCAGQALARMEGEAVLRALIEQTKTISVGQPQRAVNNLIRAFATLPVTVGAAVHS